jgi:hemoglobin-like flavoprotein
MRRATTGTKPLRTRRRALLWTLEQGLGADFTPETAEAWRAAYAALSAEMIQTAYPLQATG